MVPLLTTRGSVAAVEDPEVPLLILERISCRAASRIAG